MAETFYKALAYVTKKKDSSNGLYVSFEDTPDDIKEDVNKILIEMQARHFINKNTKKEDGKNVITIDLGEIDEIVAGRVLQIMNEWGKPLSSPKRP